MSPAVTELGAGFFSPVRRILYLIRRKSKCPTSKYPSAKPVALTFEPLKAAGKATVGIGIAIAIGHRKLKGRYRSPIAIPIPIPKVDVF
jgi:hypothetical protein